MARVDEAQRKVASGKRFGAAVKANGGIIPLRGGKTTSFGPAFCESQTAATRLNQQAHIRSTHGLDQDPNDRAGYSGGYSQVRLIDHNIIVPRLPALNSKELPMRRRTAILTQEGFFARMGA